MLIILYGYPRSPTGGTSSVGVPTRCDYSLYLYGPPVGDRSIAACVCVEELSQQSHNRVIKTIMAYPSHKNYHHRYSMIPGYRVVEGEQGISIELHPVGGAGHFFMGFAYFELAIQSNRAKRGSHSSEKQASRSCVSLHGRGYSCRSGPAPRSTARLLSVLGKEW